MGCSRNRHIVGGRGRGTGLCHSAAKGFAGTDLVTEQCLLQSEGSEAGAQDDGSTEVLSPC